MIVYRQVGREAFAAYDSIDMMVDVRAHYELDRIDRGPGGVLLREVPVQPYVKDLGRYGRAGDYEKRFDISNWAFFMAFDDDAPVAGMTLVRNTPSVDLLDGRDDLCVLWDLRVSAPYKGRGIGQVLFDKAVRWTRRQGLAQIKIECQNNNVPACKFYSKQGAYLAAFDEYAYAGKPGIQNEVQLIWYLDL